MSLHRRVRSSLLASAIAVTLLASAGQSAVSAADTENQPAPAAPVTGPAAPQAEPAANPFDEVEHLATATPKTFGPAPAPGGLAAGRVPGKAKSTDKAAATAKAKSTAKATDSTARTTAAAAGTTAAGVPCTLDGITGLSPEQFADFLADPAVTADGCLSGLIWKWDARLTPVMSDAHVQAVARRISSLAASHDGKNSSHLEEMFTYLHAVVYHDFSRTEIDTTDAPTVNAITQAVTAFGNAARTFDVTKSNANTLREALNAASGPGLRQHQLGLIKRVLATMDPSHTATHLDPAWAGAALSALSVNYLGVYPGNQDSAFHAAVAADPAYRAAFKAFATYGHLKGTTNSWVARDALSEYGRFGQVDSVKTEIVAGLGGLLGTVVNTFGQASPQWAKIVTWLNFYEACKPYGVCKADIEKQIFPYTYTYDNGAIKVRTGLDRATVDQLYYASKQVKAQFHRVIGTDQPLAGDPNTTLNIVLYASRADYENYHPIITGYDTNNGGIYIENGATFYTYQRRVPQDSSLTLEELFRHEYVHYLNGRFAVPGFFGQGPWYQGDRTTAMDEGTAEFFDGATRDNGIAVRKSLVRGIINDTAGGGPRMNVRQVLNATYSGDGFRFYNYAGTFFEFLWTERPTLLREMYTHLRNNDVSAYDAWRQRLGADSGLQQAYDRFLDAQIAKVDTLFVPNTTYTPNSSLRDVDVAAVRSAFASATYNNPDCVEAGEPGKRRFLCTGRITANLSDSNNTDKVFKDMSETVDYFLLDRAGAATNNLADMNCSFGPVDIWASRVAGTSSFTCEGPLRS
ncbi:collagenase [Streptomyces sp. NPDC056501]|uniref:collagenase n=1 Tax=Streptomyces sp. NPDC056501 TaxID=3345841 RepID=UPI0036CA3CC1